jgi:isoleucyl-tRNA synthetase
MDRVRDVGSAAHSVRKAQGLRARLPLAAVTVAGPGASALTPFTDLIADEVNVKEARVADSVGAAAELVLTVNPKVAGPRLGGDVQKAIRAVKSGDWQRQDDGTIAAAGVVLQEGEFELRMTPADESTTRVLAGGDSVVVLDTEVTSELEAEGVARDVVRCIQEARRKEGLHVSDRIRLVLEIHADEVRDAVERHQGWLMEQTLALELDLAPLAEGHRCELPDGRAVRIAVTRLDA